MRLCCFMTLVVTTATAGGVPAPDAGKTDEEKLQGKWTRFADPLRRLPRRPKRR